MITDDEIRDKWFGGNHDAMMMYKMIAELSHTWDDLVDKDNDVSSENINRAFMMPLFYLQNNAFYRSIQDQILPFWMMVYSGYEVANHFEKTKNEHGLEIAHNLRYAAGHIVSYAVISCLGYKEAAKVLPDVWLEIVYERFDDYKKEHI